MSTSVKHIHNGMRGAPQISGTAGTLIAALDALFTTGWGVTTAISVTVASGIATALLIVAVAVKYLPLLPVSLSDANIRISRSLDHHIEDAPFN